MSNKLTMSQLYARKLKNYPYVARLPKGDISKEKFEYEVLRGTIFTGGHSYKRGTSLKLTELQANTSYKNMVVRIRTAPSKKSKPEKTNFKGSDAPELNIPAGDQIKEQSK